MKVIGAGFPRTGTLSMQAALQQLGYPCYHMKEVLKNSAHVDMWHPFVSGQAPMDWQTLFRGFEATVDAPACFYYQELMQEFPDAKVVLTVREPEPWHKSWALLNRTVDRSRPVARIIPKLRKLLRFADPFFQQKISVDPQDPETCIRAFEAHNEAVQRHVPPDRLLVFRVTEGWEPLCTFLGCDVPEGVPFPHLNEGDQTLKAMIQQFFIGPWARRVLLPVLGLGLVVLAWWLL